MTQTDRELLVLAAKAAGIDLAWSSMDDVPPRRTDTWDNWSSLADDGDCARLRNRLRMEVIYTDQGVNVALDGVLLAFEAWDGDDMRSERRAVTRAAAETQIAEAQAHARHALDTATRKN